MTEEPVSGEQFAGLCAIRDRYDAAEGLYDTLYSKADQETEAASMSAMVVFPLYYLALVLTRTAATILTSSSSARQTATGDSSPCAEAGHGPAGDAAGAGVPSLPSITPCLPFRRRSLQFPFS